MENLFDENYKEICTNIAECADKIGKSAKDITLLAATKTVDINLINYSITKGITTIGENKVQEFLQKENKYLPVKKHLIGHLQTNKIKDIVGKVDLIQSVDSIKLCKAISDYAQKNNIRQNILLEVNIGREESKSGFTKEGLYNSINEISEMEGIFVKGLMTIPPISYEDGANKKYFLNMKDIFLDISQKRLYNIKMDILSMGMSNDYCDAILFGSNMVRIGTALYGKRNYNI